MNKLKFKKALANKTNCTIQHNGWTCATCFYAIDESLDNPEWQSLLLYRGDTKKEHLNNLPKDYEGTINKIWNLIKDEVEE